MSLPINDNLTITSRYLTFSATRSRGPGGQNVNKLNTAVELTFDLDACPDLSPPVKRRLRRLAGRRTSSQGHILLTSDQHRSQLQNRQECLDRLADLVRRALIAPKRRKPTRPTKASKERRLQSKREQSEKKQQRRNIPSD